MSNFAPLPDPGRRIASMRSIRTKFGRAFRRQSFDALLPSPIAAVLLLALTSAVGASSLPEELIVAVDPTVLGRIAPESRALFLKGLLGRYGVGEPTHFDRVGAAVFALPEGLSLADARALARNVGNAPGVIHSTLRMGEAQRRHIEQRKSFAAGTSDRNIFGLIVKYRSQTMAALSRANQPLSKDELERLGEIAGTRIVGSRAMSGDAFVVSFAEPIHYAAAQSMLSRLGEDPAIEYVSPDELVEIQVIPNDPFFNQQWSLAGTSGGIDAPNAWEVTTGSPATVVAVLDTGILGHSQFSGRLLPGYDFVSSAARSGDGNGRDSNAMDAGDWVEANFCYPGAPAKNSSWHGTHVAGIIAANGNNTVGTAGIDWQAKILPVRVLGKCGGTIGDIVDGMRWAAGLPVPGVPANPTPARVINMSLGGNTPCWKNYAEQAAALEILAGGAALVVSAGNSTDEAANYSPAGCYGVLTVGATGPDADRAFYSNFSELVVNLSGPGGNQRDFGIGGGVLSTFATGTQSAPESGTYVFKQGTSQAAPHVSGVVALMLGANPQLTIAQIRDLLAASASPFPAGSSCATRGDCGAGIVNAAKAVAYARDLVGTKWNFTDHWYFPPENGWGVQVTAQGEIQFVTWYIYAVDGSPFWLTMVLTRRSQDIFVGEIYATLGVPFEQINGKPSATTEVQVGTAVLAYFGYSEAWLYYNILGNEAAKPLTRLQYGNPLTLCLYTTQSLADAANFQGMWWNPPETGWGINLTHQADTIFATWFTYGPTGQPLWLFMVATRVSPGVYSGLIEQASGLPLNQVDGNPALTDTTVVGFGTLTFSSGERGRFDYSAFGFTGSKPIEPQIFASPGTKCQPLQ